MRAALLTLLISSWLYFFSYPEADNDLWGHLFFGKVIWEEQGLPADNRYSYTAPEHPWINHEWLAELLFYGVYALFGSRGLIALKLAVAGGVIALLDRTIRQSTGCLAARATALVWAMSLVAPGFNVRPQIFTYLLFALTLLVLQHSQESQGKGLYRLAPLLALWVNLHGGFVAGLGAVGLFYLWALCARLWSLRRADLWAPLALLIAALLANPYGVHLLLFLGQDLALARRITEWQPLPLVSLSAIDFKIAAVIVFWAVVRKRLWERWEGMLVVLAALLGIWQQRHTPLFGIAAAPLLAAAIAEGYVWLRQHAPIGIELTHRSLRWIIYGLIGGQLLWFGQIHWQHRFRIVVNPSEFPTQAADFLRRNGIYGNVAVPFDWGEYFIWKLYPASRVSIDGRYTTAYPLHLIEESWGWMEGGKDWRNLLDHYPTEIAVTDRRHPITALLRADAEWVYIYSDPIAFIFLRKTAAQQSSLRKFGEKKLFGPETPPLYFPG